MTVRTTAALLGAMLVASTAGAQGKTPVKGKNAATSAAPKCNIQSGGSVRVSAAYDALSKFNTASGETADPKFLMTAVKELSTAPDKPGTEIARQWVLGQTLVAFTLIDGQPTAGPRKNFGYASDPEAPIDILLAADSAFQAVETASPGCKSQIEPMRRMAVIAATNAATAQFNGGNLDSTAVLAARVLKLQPDSPHAYHLMANVEVKKQNYQAAADNFERVLAATATDSTLADLHESALISEAYLLQNLADAEQDDALSKPLAEKAANYFREYLKTNPTDASASSALARTLVTAGDTAAASNMYGTMLADPSRYSAMDLLNAGVGAANAEKYPEAMSLLEAGVAGNPYLRDGLFVLTQVALKSEQYDKAADAARRLVEVDPNNPDNYNLLAGAYQGLLGNTKDKKIQKAFTDSMLRANAKASSMPVRVTVADFAEPGAGQRVLNGTIENLADAPTSYELKVDFLDEKGNVLASKTETVADVAGKSSKSFSIAVQQPGIVAYRYAPLGG